jgi:raffinose/stachyose/melibiose transport system substrate-binding protein
MKIGRTALAAAVTGLLAVTACTPGSLGDSDGDGTSLSYLVDNEPSTVKTAEALAKAFNAKYPELSVKVETRPQGGEGDNIVKTRLSTGDMTDIFAYNSGSLFQALKPEQNLTPLDDQALVGTIDPTFGRTVTAGGKVYGVPTGGTVGGGVYYNRAVYSRLGLQVPKTWAEFMANNAKIKAAGVAPVVQTYQTTWTSQLIYLADYHNVASAQPDFADQYTANKVKVASTPAALRSFQRLQEVHDAGYKNSDFASAQLENGLKMIADGTGAHYPMLTFTVATIVANSPDKAKDVGFFALPGEDAAKNGLTVWMPGGIYVPKTTTGAKLDAAKKFLAFVASPEGCDVQSRTVAPSGPYVVKGCSLPADVPQAVKDMQPYFDAAKTTPALEFLSPVKGPALEQICVEVGSGIRKAGDAAELYDRDVQKQAQQLGLPGW